MNIIIPMAGLGKRFADKGFVMPKPLIKVAGKLMYQWAVDCMPTQLATNLVFIISDNEFSKILIKDITEKYPSSSIVIQHEPLKGQADTVLKASEKLNLKIPTLVHNCDTYVELDNSSFNQSINSDGAIILFNSIEPRWSYAKLDKNNTKVIEVKEKQVISCNASTGTYFFKDTELLLENIQLLIDQDLRENNEYYLSTVYTLMIEQQKNITPLWCKKILCFGTPQDLVNSLNKMLTT